MLKAEYVDILLDTELTLTIKSRGIITVRLLGSRGLSDQRASVQPLTH
jgi:hypothetical protein